MQTGASSRVLTAVMVAYTLAVALWAGGLSVLGAIVAPTVFRIVPAPTSADAMTIVFRRFDVVAISCAVVALLAEATLAWRGGRPQRSDIVRGLATVVASTMAIVTGTYLAPGIEALHRGGAVRRLGESGLELERLHHLAESAAKVELACLLVGLTLLIVRLRRDR